MSLLHPPPDQAVVAHSNLTPQSSVPARIFISDRRVFMAATGTLYAVAILLATRTLHPYFAQTWDVMTFIHAARSLFSGNNPFDLYAASRAAQTWPYAYPPLHAIVVALALGIGDLLHILPDYFWARVPALLADIGVGIRLYAIVERRSNDATLARAALVLWLFNPVTFYDTAVQGHFESEWLLFVLLAYAWSEHSRNIIPVSITLAVAVLFKQIAIVFALPVWAFILVGAKHLNLAKARSVEPSQGSNASPLRDAFMSASIFGIIVALVCLPFLLYSNDFLYMNLTYVENVPVQTQSWLVPVLGLTRTASNALTSDFFLLRYQTIITMLAALVIAFMAARRGWSLYLAGALIAIGFFLTSKKVMGYYYVMLLPFLLAELLPRRRFDLVLAAILATAFISLSPYYADWTNHAHWWIYAVLGTLNSVFFVWLFTTSADRRPPTAAMPTDRRLDSLVGITSGLFATAVFAAVLQPLIGSAMSPIRAPIIAPGMETNALLAFGILIGLVVIALAIITRGMGGTVGIRAWASVLIFAPLFFAVYTLTKESTAVFEFALKALGG